MDVLFNTFLFFVSEEGFGQKDAFHFLDRTQNRFKKRFALRFVIKDNFVLEDKTLNQKIWHN